ncbi:MAG: hypothetical protein H7338_02985, partial [Candidatus Sericytochromatia bacterium]|nr:hypothetical protein [Candidatus Sericytochromatia bacterium]
MPNIFDTFSLGNYFSIDASTRSLTRVANAITSGTPSFDRILLNDEDIRERARVHKEGVDFDRERLSSLIGKVQQLQARLQATYQSMLDRQLSTNSAEVGTNHEVPDTTIFSQNVWKSVGRGALQFSKAAHSDKDVIDTWTDGPNNLGRLSYFRPDAVGNMYQERGGYYTALNYLWGFDLHQLRYTYATGTLGPQPLGTPGVPLGSDQLFEMDAIDFNKMANIVWKLGDVIKLDPAKVFTPEFTLAFPPIKQGDIKYQNGSGYQFTPVTYLYAYVREVDILPDGVTKPRSIDLISGPVPASD